ncbi:hypothetical protein D6D01_05367 [Aureobasidium pullulans]|uniref:Uncharacterized protein n=1 Tax=Aureobasidium pullulans TaxID=5580 RepID=A0A4S9L7N6_AURPU|nr:hypothetical protein D6D01_05367 [Aureobasidium pullulans]
MAKPPTDPRLQRCLTRLEHLFASWEECNGKPDNHRKDDTEALFEDAYILPTKIFSLERKEQDIKNKLAKLEEVLESITARTLEFVLEDPSLHRQRDDASDGLDRLSEEHLSVLAEIVKSKDTSDKAMETNMEILEERHELEWFGRTLDHIEPA